MAKIGLTKKIWIAVTIIIAIIAVILIIQIPKMKSINPQTEGTCTAGFYNGMMTYDSCLAYNMHTHCQPSVYTPVAGYYETKGVCMKN